ncbi:TniQ family protein [Yimella sp. cx-51]|uniref:TniQ family protein n=1 Tax=Yimella sp. cx-51 TaxID=2770551 RepID=UPI00165EB53C|nr:TniQ family protein [Yimella sp. cx-51]MBC9957827.1 TniQ family protein [Yimella sp. cx-51]QTH37969.1 TniQ family protein [Yimella sp. cx-51]
MTPPLLKRAQFLPVEVAPVVGEAADGYLERVAEANNLSPSDMKHMTGVGTVTQLRRRTLGDGRPRPAARPGPDGWTPGTIVQACPRCLADDGIWKADWYDPLTTACLRHGTLLIGQCPDCRRPLRDTTHTWIRPNGAATLCGNPLTRGRGPRCSTDLAALDAQMTERGVRKQQERHAASTALVLGKALTAEEYRATLKALAVLMLHIVSAAQNPPQSWELPTTKRWYLRPPQDPIVRAEVLAEADRILTAPDQATAATAFQPWFDAIPAVWDGPTSWALDHTRATSMVARLINAAAAPKQRLGHRLNCNVSLSLDSRFIPQRIPASFEQLPGSGLSEATSRGFAALCLARAQPGVTTWADAARVLGLPPHRGVDVARTASAHLSVTPDGWIAHLRTVAAHLLDDAVDYRYRENLVREFDGSEVVAVLRQVRPGTRTNSHDLIRTWLWENWANADPPTTPERSVAKDRRSRARYAQFKQHLRIDDGQHLMHYASGQEIAAYQGVPRQRPHTARQARRRLTAAPSSALQRREFS